MKLGVIGRCEQRGIGIQTSEFISHMPVDRVLDIVIHSRWRRDISAYHSVPHTSVAFDHARLPERQVRDWLSGLDVVFSVETVYDWRLIDWAHDAGAVVVVQGNPEFYRHGTELRDAPEPDEWWWPTSWRLDRLPSGPVMNVPIRDQPPFLNEPSTTARFLHVAGHRAAGDRNGTDIFMAALRFVTEPCLIRVVGQDGVLPDLPKLHPNVQVEMHPDGFDDRWEMYRDIDVVVLPRRYGGLCLPALEALTVGAIPMMPSVSPNTDWPIIPVDGRFGPSVRTPAGPIATFNVHPKELAEAMNTATASRAHIEHFRDLCSVTRPELVWSVWKPVYMAQMESLLR